MYSLQSESSTEPPQSNTQCPRRNGFFAHPDPAVCNVFYNCIEGEPIETKCTAGLHFDEYSGTCVWPDAAGRQGCNAQDSKLCKIIPYNYEMMFGIQKTQFNLAGNLNCYSFCLVALAQITKSNDKKQRKYILYKLGQFKLHTVNLQTTQ